MLPTPRAELRRSRRGCDDRALRRLVDAEQPAHDAGHLLKVRRMEDREVVAVKRPLAVTQIIKFSSRYRSFKSSAIGPFPYLDGRFRNFADLTETFTLDVEQLGRVDKCAAYIELTEGD